MNDTTKFVSDLTTENKAAVVVRFFDEIMVLYNLVGCREDLVIYADSTAELATFRITTDSEEAARELYETLNQSSFTVYNDLYNIDMTLSGSSVLTTIITNATN